MKRISIIAFALAALVCFPSNSYAKKQPEVKNVIYLIGDGSGITRGLSQSGAMGLYVADHIYGKIED